MKKTGRTGAHSPVLPVSVSNDRSVITLLSDFGTRDYFVGSIKGVILSINPHVNVVDITHDVPSHDIAAGAFTLLSTYRTFGPRTIHVAVVDPGVGSTRRPLLVAAAEQFFIGPDNGIFSFVYESEPNHEVYELTNDMYFRHPVSATFHGRDIFAPVAAALSTGIAALELGDPIVDALRLDTIEPKQLDRGGYKGRVLHIDRFGNCITNFKREMLSVEDEHRARITIKTKSIRSFRPFFSSTDKHREKLFAIWGSAGFLEIASYEQSAAKRLKTKVGDPVLLKLD